MWSCGYITCTWYLRVTKALMLEDAFVGVLFVCFGKGGVQRVVGGGRLLRITLLITEPPSAGDVWP